MITITPARNFFNADSPAMLCVRAGLRARNEPDFEFPRAIARLERGAHGYWRWRVDQCPFIACPMVDRCGGHYHGGGPLSGDPRDFLGHRAHVDSKGYLLIDGAPRRTAELVEEVRVGRKGQF